MLSYYQDNGFPRMETRPTTIKSDDRSSPSIWFEQWWEPQALLADVRAHRDPVPPDVRHNRPELKWMQEALAAAQFATVRHLHTPLSIRLERTRFPDFQIRTDGGDESFELVEADRTGRKRGKEYREAAKREAAGGRSKLHHVDLYEEHEAAVKAIATALQKKAAKHYKPAPHLLVYVNFQDDLSFSFSEAQLLVSLCEHRFPSAWLLCCETVAQIWPRCFRIRS